MIRNLDVLGEDHDPDVLVLAPDSSVTLSARVAHRTSMIATLRSVARDRGEVVGAGGLETTSMPASGAGTRAVRGN